MQKVSIFVIKSGSQDEFPGCFFLYRGLVAKGPVGSAIKRSADEAILSE
ncbi:MAG: hypothetical protein PUB54_08715 [Lachnospiraceae bacterium]|nr:hypothetical protein [Lachnospiraceae bacterium]